MLDAESYIPFSVQLFVILQLLNSVEQDHIVRGFEMQNQKQSRKPLTCPIYLPISRHSQCAVPRPVPEVEQNNKRLEKNVDTQTPLRALSYRDRRPMMADYPPAHRGGWRRPWRTAAPGWDGGGGGCGE